MGLTVSEKSVFPTSFARGCFLGNLFSFEKKWLQKILFDVICLEIRHKVGPECELNSWPDSSVGWSV